MIERDYFRKAKICKFNLCRYCPLYECELIQEYEQFRDNHHTDDKPLYVPQTSNIFSNEPLVVQGRSYIASPDNTEQTVGHAVSVPTSQEDVIRKETCLTRESDPDIDFLSYDKEELKNGCIMSQRHVCPIECGRQRVTEGIGDHFKIEIKYDGKIMKGIENRWEPKQPVFISAQTGQGKNYFIDSK